MKIKRNGSQPSAKEATEYFTGTVRVDRLFPAHEPARTSGAYVTFERAPAVRGTPIRSVRP